MTTKTAQRHLYVSMLVSLDGYIEGPHNELDWFDDENPQFERYCDEMIDSVDVALFGRRSYDLMFSYWPKAEAEAGSPRELAFARKMNALPKVVFSRTLERAEWSNTRIVRDRIAEHVTELKSQPGKSIVVWAGAEVVSTLSDLDLVDEYRLVVHPVLLGSGTPYFKNVRAPKKLRHVRTTQLGEGLVVLCYEPRRT
jgi:dihydrofolate reductase